MRTSFQKITDTFATVYKEGVVALGTTRYPNRVAVMQALKDPNSAASRFRVWQNRFEKILFAENIKSAYKTASICYSQNNQKVPPVLKILELNVGNVGIFVSSWSLNTMFWQYSAESTHDLVKLGGIDPLLSNVQKYINLF